LQPQVPFEGIEVSILVQECEPAVDATRCDDPVDRLSDRYAACTQTAEVVRSVKCGLRAAQLNYSKRKQELSRSPKMLVASEALEHFSQDQVAYSDGFCVKNVVEEVRLPSWHTSKIIDPNAGIYQNQRSVLISLRSPCQSSFPLNFLI
jgi:hypothetical protein